MSFIRHLLQQLGLQTPQAKPRKAHSPGREAYRNFRLAYHPLNRRGEQKLNYR